MRKKAWKQILKESAIWMFFYTILFVVFVKGFLWLWEHGYEQELKWFLDQWLPITAILLLILGAMMYYESRKRSTE